MEDEKDGGIDNSNGANTDTNENLQTEFNEITEVKGEEHEEKQEAVEEVKQEVIKEAKQEKPVLDKKVETPVIETVSKKEHDELVAKFAALEKQVAKPVEAEKPLLTEKDLQTTEVPVEQVLLNQFEQSDMIAMLSGDIERARPVLQKFAKGIIECIYYDMNQKQQQQNKVKEYAEKIYNSFYTEHKDLVGNEKIVKYVFDDFCRLNPNAMPHTFIGDVAVQARELIAKLKGDKAETEVKKNPPVRRIETTKGGEAGDVRPTVSSTPQLTDQEKEMFELLPDHNKTIQ